MGDSQQCLKCMKHLLIVGARGWGREVLDAFCGTEEYLKGLIDVKGFLDSNEYALDGLKGDYPSILCSPEDYAIQPDDIFFIAMGDPHWRKHYAEIIENKGGEFHTIVCRNAYVVSNATIGKGSYVGGWSVVSDNVVLGQHNVIHSFCTLGHDARLGDCATMESYSFLGGYAEMGDCSIMHVRSTLIRHKKIGNDVSVGAGSVVMRNVKDGLHVFGSPAMKIDL